MVLFMEARGKYQAVPGTLCEGANAPFELSLNCRSTIESLSKPATQSTRGLRNNTPRRTTGMPGYCKGNRSAVGTHRTFARARTVKRIGT